jgi:PAS domain S-box-containing protein
MLNALRPVLETALDAVVIMHPDGTVAAWNPTAEKTFGWGEAEALGRIMADLIVPSQHREAHRRGLERYLSTGEERVLNRRIEITAINKAGREFPIELSITVTSNGSEQLFVGYLRDISVRRLNEERLARQAREARLLYEVTNLSSETASFDEALRVTLRAICTLTGWPVGHAFLLRRRDTPELVSTGVWHETNVGDASDLRRATEDLRFGEGFGLPGKVLELGAPTWVSDTARDPNFVRKGFGFRSAFAFPVTSEGKTVAVIEFFGRETSEPDAELLLTVRTLGEQIGRVLERIGTAEHQRLLLNELNHRVKNTLAVVQGVASQTFKGDAASPDARRAFDNRLSALAAAHDVLTGKKWESASIRDIISRAGLGCGASGQRWRAAGPDIQLRPRAAVALAMALHELCTNAVKYGALSGDSGGVEISWRISAENTLRLVWAEAGGPRVRQPEARGFGSKMIERALASELGGSVDLRFDEEGVQCVIEAPLTD